MKSPSPAFSVYPKDILSDETCTAMSHEEFGMYMRLLMHAWLEGSIPADHVRLQRILGVTAKTFKACWPAIEVCWTALHGFPERLIQRRQEVEREKQHAFQAEQSRRGKKGGKSNRINKTSKPALHIDDSREQAGEKPRLTPPSPSPTTDYGALSLSPSQGSVTDYGLEPCNSSKGKPEPVPMESRQEYAEAVREAFAAKTSRPAYQFNGEDGYWLKRWMDEGIRLATVLRGINGTRGVGHKLAYYNSAVMTEYESVRLALSGTR